VRTFANKMKVLVTIFAVVAFTHGSTSGWMTSSADQDCHGHLSWPVNIFSKYEEGMGELGNPLLKLPGNH
jgi:hypothetical protein